MKSRMLVIMITSLLLAACGGSGASGPLGGQEESIVYFGENLPNFQDSSITHTANVDASGRTADVATTEFRDGDIYLTVRQGGETRMAINSAEHATVGRDGQTITDIPFGNIIPEHDRQIRHALSTRTPSGQGPPSPGDSVTSLGSSVLISWSSDDPTDYLSAGHWVKVNVPAGPVSELSAEDVTDPVTGSFVNGPELDGVPSLPMRGTARYTGGATGGWAVLFGEDSEQLENLFGSGNVAHRGDRIVGTFSADAELVVDFAVSTISGCIGCKTGFNLANYRIFESREQEEGHEQVVNFIDSYIVLEPTDIMPDGTFQDRGSGVARGYYAADPSIDINERQSGSWGGKFSTIANANGNPRLVAGTFSRDATTSGGTRRIVSGAFFAADSAD